MNAELWNPVNGEIRSLENLANTTNGIKIKVKLDAFESFFIIFYHYVKKSEKGTSSTENFPERSAVMDIEGPWNVAFDTAWGGPEYIVFDTLEDWTERREEGIRYYSGIAVYSIDFYSPGLSEKRKKQEYFLDLGKVRNIARVRLNGKDLGIVWTAPWHVNISDALRKKNNHLEIEVANLWINRLIGDESKPWDGVEDGKWPEWLLKGTPRKSGRYTFTTHRYYKEGDSLVESGLIGPVQLLISD